MSLTAAAAPWVRLTDYGTLTCDGCGRSHQVRTARDSDELMAVLWAVWLASHTDCHVRAVG